MSSGWVAFAASKTSRLKIALNSIGFPQASVNFNFNVYVPLLVLVKFSNSKLSVVAMIAGEVIPLSKLHSKTGLELKAIIVGSVILKVTSSPLQYFKF